MESLKLADIQDATNGYFCRLASLQLLPDFARIIFIFQTIKNKPIVLTEWDLQLKNKLNRILTPDHRQQDKITVWIQ